MMTGQGQSSSGPVWKPYYWAGKVHAHLNGLGLLQQAPFKIDAIKEATKAISDINEIDLVAVPLGRIPPVIHGVLRRVHAAVSGSSMPKFVGRIEYEARLPGETQRLVICKELAQLFYSDDPQNRSAGVDQVYALFEGLANGQAQKVLPAASPALVSEELAMLTAIEILCPFEVREQIMGTTGGQLSALRVQKISRQFGIPDWIVEPMFETRFHDNARLGRGAIY